MSIGATEIAAAIEGLIAVFPSRAARARYGVAESTRCIKGALAIDKSASAMGVLPGHSFILYALSADFPDGFEDGKIITVNDKDYRIRSPVEIAEDVYWRLDIGDVNA